jgi:hypothetical protein
MPAKRRAWQIEAISLRLTPIASLIRSWSAGVVVGPAATYATALGTPTTMVDWQAGTTNMYQGIRFTNEVTTLVTYGWVALTTTGPTGFPATINQFCYQDDATAITTGVTTPVRLQDFTVD